MKIKKIERVYHETPVAVYNLTVNSKEHVYPINLTNTYIFSKNCDEINEKFGLDIDIELNKEVIDLLNITENDIINYEDRGVDDGEIYNYN